MIRTDSLGLSRRLAAALVACAAALLMLAGAAAPAAAKTLWSTRFDDLPLPTAFVETDDGFAFETVRGAIVRVAAEGAASPDDVAAFYAETLPALGWRRRDADSSVFDRAGETLSVEVKAAATGGSRLIIDIRPRTDSQRR